MTDDPTPENSKPASAGDQQGRDPVGRFAGGVSGNPAGRAAGSRNKATLAVEALFEGEADAIGRRAIELALAGDSTALRLVIERICPVRKGRAITFDLPQIEAVADLPTALGAVLAATAAGELTPDEAATVATLLEAKRKALETLELERRIVALEQKDVNQ